MAFITFFFNLGYQLNWTSGETWLEISGLNNLIITALAFRVQVFSSLYYIILRLSH